MTKTETVEIAIATAQLVAAVVSLGAAWWIADNQRRRSELAERQRPFDFQNTMLTLANYAVMATEDALARAAAAPHLGEAIARTEEGVMMRSRLARSASAVLPTVPAHASLAIAGAALCAALEAPVATNISNSILDPYPTERCLAEIREAMRLLKDAM